ncbi:MAG: 3D domain-containing protein [Defluviitaleaceae bacterium]|nr:3D domain-containing protein [Defluviitaleaceae bacterium]
MKKLKVAVYVVLFALIASIAIPFGVLSFTAAETVLRQVTVYDQNEQHIFLTQAATVEEALRELGIALNDFDRTSHSLSGLIWDGITITLEREINFYFEIDGNPLLTRFSRPGVTIEEVLTQLQQEQELALLFDGDHTRQVASGETLSFTSWQSRLIFDTYYVLYQTIENYTGAVSRGRRYVRQDGVLGVNEITTAIVYIGGAEINREAIGTAILSEPIDKIIDIGTAWLGSMTNPFREDFHYFRRVRMEATAYTAGYGCTGKHPCDPWYRITASGREVQHGIVAVDRNVIPLGTRLFVEGYGFALAADVGGAIRGYKIDLFMEDLQDALRFGRRHLYVWILDEIEWSY